MRILILGGTGSARVLADHLVEDGHQVTSSMAGRTRNARLPRGGVRVGGFGGVAGLVDYLELNRIEALINATHPFAAQMNGHAFQACQQVGIPTLRLTRHSWADRPEADTWWWAVDHDQAGCLAQQFPGTILLTVGRQHSNDYYRPLADRRVLCRTTMAPDDPLPETWEMVVDRGPFDLAGEMALFAAEQVALLITKDSGGEQTAAKLDAAASLGVQVIMIARPPLLAGQTAVTSADQALSWVADLTQDQR